MPSGFGIPVPNPLNLFGGGLFGGDPFSSFFAAFGKMIFNWIVSTAAAVFDAVVKATNNTGPISFDPSSWWGTKVGLANAGTSLWATVIGLSLVVMLCCVILAAIQGAIQGEPMMAVKAVGLAVPTSMFGIVAVVAVTAVLVAVVDDASSAVLAGLDPNFKTWFAHTSGGGFMPGFVMFVALLGGLLVWMELILRAGFVYLFVLLAPLALAVRVWPAMGGFFRRFAEIGIALIVSKFVIAVALALGSAAMAGGSQDPASAQGISAMATGAGLMLVSAFAPFVILRMVHGVEGAVAHQGMSHAPGRAAMTAVNLAASGLLIGRLAGGSGGGVRGGGGGGVALAEPAAGTGPPGNAVALSGRWGPTGGIAPAPVAPPQPLPPGPTLSLPPGPAPSPPPGPPPSPPPPPPPVPPAGGQPTSLGSSAVFIDVESRPGAASDQPIGSESN